MGHRSSTGVLIEAGKSINIALQYDPKVVGVGRYYLAIAFRFHGFEIWRFVKVLIYDKVVEDLQPITRYESVEPKVPQKAARYVPVVNVRFNNVIDKFTKHWERSKHGTCNRRPFRNYPQSSETSESRKSNSNP